MVDQVAAISAAIDRDINRLIIRIAETVVEELAQETPKLTGWASSNWIPTIGTPFPGTTGSKSAVSFVAQTIGLGQLRKYDYRRGLPIFIANSVPYIVPLNMGTSRKAPPMFVERAIATAIEQAIRGG